jgi:hypothetical protein
MLIGIKAYFLFKSLCDRRVTLAVLIQKKNNNIGFLLQHIKADKLHDIVVT